MERLLVLRLEARSCVAEALLNGVPLGRVGPGAPVLTLPVHEYTVAGLNDIELRVEPGVAGAWPDPEPHLSDGQIGASLRLLLPRVGSAAHPSTARSLAVVEWAPAKDELYEVPHQLAQQVELSVKFPRWSWLEAPVMADSPGLREELASFLLELTVGLIRGKVEPLLQASRLRLEEVALAYQRELADDVARLRVHLERWAGQDLALPTAAKLLPRWVAGGRLVECLAQDGAPLLQGPLAGGGVGRWPLRVARIEGKFYVLR